MAKVNWDEFVLLLTDRSSKESEVTGEQLGGEYQFTSLPLSQYKPGDWIQWTRLSDYGENHCTVYCEEVSDEMIKLKVYNRSDQSSHKYPHYPEFRQDGDEWSSGWYEWGYWSYCHKIRLVKKGNLQSH